MKFWKPMLLTAFIFIGISATILFSACEKDSCTDLQCYNGGACSSGFCHCTTGYEGAECEIWSEQRFLGTYIGVTTCDTAAGLLDTVDITSSGVNTQVNVFKHTSGDYLTGTVNITGGQYLIIVPSQTVNGNTQKTFSIQWDANKLNFLTHYVVNGTVVSTCTFVGTKK